MQCTPLAKTDPFVLFLWALCNRLDYRRAVVSYVIGVGLYGYTIPQTFVCTAIKRHYDPGFLSGRHKQTAVFRQTDICKGEEYIHIHMAESAMDCFLTGCLDTANWMPANPRIRKAANDPGIW
jgi:hypothetical protein